MKDDVLLIWFVIMGVTALIGIAFSLQNIAHSLRILAGQP